MRTARGLTDLQIIQQDANGNIVKQWARPGRLLQRHHAELEPAKGQSKSKLDRMAEYPNRRSTTIEISGWRETPGGSPVPPRIRTICRPEPRDYLSFNRTSRSSPRSLPHSIAVSLALPWVCLLVVFIAAPLGIVYSRRGILGSVATAIALFFLPRVLQQLVCCAL